MANLSERSEKTLLGVHPDLVRLVKAAIENTPVDFTVVQGVRTAEYQNGLYQQGRTKPGIKVTDKDGYKKKSNHQAKADGYGHAVDIYPFYDGIVQTGYGLDKAAEKVLIARQILLGSHIKAEAKRLKISITWGGDWKSLVDRPHFELSL